MKKLTLCILLLSLANIVFAETETPPAPPIIQPTAVEKPVVNITPIVPTSSQNEKPVSYQPVENTETVKAQPMPVMQPSSTKQAINTPQKRIEQKQKELESLRSITASSNNKNGKTIKQIQEDNAKIDFAPYMREVQNKIKQNWNPPKINVSKRVTILFKIDRNGNVISQKVTQSSGNDEMDLAAAEALHKSEPFKPLPKEYYGNSVDVSFTFDYNVIGNRPSNSSTTKTNTKQQLNASTTVTEPQPLQEENNNTPDNNRMDLEFLYLLFIVAILAFGTFLVNIIRNLIQRSRRVLQPNIVHAREFYDIGHDCIIDDDDKNAYLNFVKATELDPNNAEYFYMRALYSESEIEQLDCINTAIRLDSKNSQYYSYRAALQDNDEDAIFDYSQAIKYSNNKTNKEKLAQYYGTRGVLYVEIKEYDKALRDFNKVIDNYPTELDYLNRGDVYKSLGKRQEAEKDYLKVVDMCTKKIKLDKNYAIFYSTRCEAYMKLNDYQKALEDINTAIEVCTNNMQTADEDEIEDYKDDLEDYQETKEEILKNSRPDQYDF